MSRCERRTHRVAMVAVLCACLAASSACEEVPSAVKVPRIDLQTVRIIVPSLNDTIWMDAFTGQVTSGPITTVAINTDFVAEFLKADGSPQPIVTGAAYRLDVRAENVNLVTFAATGPFTGTLHKVNAGSTNVVFILVNRSDNIQEFVRGIPIVVN
jgi:hypothetical protein